VIEVFKHLIVMDCPRYLEDRDAHHRLQLSAEVTVSIRTKDGYGNDKIGKGRADWAAQGVLAKQLNAEKTTQ